MSSAVSPGKLSGTRLDEKMQSSNEPIAEVQTEEVDLESSPPKSKEFNRPITP